MWYVVGGTIMKCAAGRYERCVCVVWYFMPVGGWSCWQKTPHHVYDLLLGAKKEEIEPTFAAFAVVIISEMNAGSKNY